MDFFTLGAGSEAALAQGSVRVFGVQNSAETIILAQPPQGTLEVTFDPSFNTGGDTIAFDGDAEDYTIALSGSSVIISNAAITATIPVGRNETNIVFLDGGAIQDGDLRTLRADPAVNGDPLVDNVIALGNQVIEPGEPPAPIEPLTEAPELVFTGPFSTAVPENQTAAFDADLVGSPEVVFALGGADVGLFTIDEQTGIVTFNTAPDFEMPADADGDNVYELSVSASAMATTIAQDVSITVTDVPEPIPPVGQVLIATGLRDAIAPTASEANDAGRLNSDFEIVTDFGVTPAITGRLGVDTEVERAQADTQLRVSGENQTVGEGNNNADQFFGIIQLEDSATDMLELQIENTARVDGTLVIEQLIVNRSSEDDDTTAPVDTLTIASGGTRQTSNIIREISAEETEEIILTGTQDLGFLVTGLASAGRDDLLIDAQALGGRLVLGIAGDLLNGGDDDRIIGTDSAADRLAFFGTLEPGTNTDIEAIENLQFGIVRPSLFADLTASAARSVEGEFNFANVGDYDETITITNLSGPLALVNFFNDVIINIGDGTGGAAAPITQFNDMIGMTEIDNSLTFNGADSRDDITVNLTPFLGGSAGGLLDGPATNFLSPPMDLVDFIDINGFETATLTVSRQITLGSSASNYSLDLRLDNAVGIDLDAASLSLDDDVADFVTDTGSDLDAVRVDDVLEELTIRGGQTDRIDQLDVGEALLGSIAVIDISAYHGAFIGTVVNAVEVDGNDVDSANVDRTIIIGDDDVTITLQELIGGTDAASIDTNTTFRFTDGVPSTGDADGIATWTINNFVIADPDGSSFTNTDLSNFSRLNLSGLGLTSFTQLVIEPDGMGNTVITTEDADWQIILTGVDPAELTADSENFDFTSLAQSKADAGEVALAPALDPAMAMVESFALA